MAEPYRISVQLVRAEDRDSPSVEIVGDRRGFKELADELLRLANSDDDDDDSHWFAPPTPAFDGELTLLDPSEAWGEQIDELTFRLHRPELSFGQQRIDAAGAKLHAKRTVTSSVDRMGFLPFPPYFRKVLDSKHSSRSVEDASQAANRICLLV